MRNKNPLSLPVSKLFSKGDTEMKKTSVISTVVLIVAMLALSACSSIAQAANIFNNAPVTVPQIPAAATPSSAQAAAPTSPQAAAPVTAPLQQNGLLSTYETTLESIYSQVSPSVVSIQVVDGNTPASSQDGGFGSPQSNVPQQALGSGFVWDTQGHIVTNNHVVDGATSVEVTFMGGKTVTAKIIGTDPYSDLAVIQVNPSGLTLNPVTLGDSTQVKVGQMAIAIGNPFGLQNTMTNGIVSGVSRTLPSDLSGNATGPTYSIPDIIQTDAAINPGNSGGVLLNDQAEVIGVTSAIESGSGSNSGIGFVIPAAIVKQVIPILISTGHFDHPYIGISGTDLTPDLASAMGLNPDTQGALVGEVSSGGPAANAGLQPSTKSVTINGLNTTVGGDVITAINGTAIKGMDDLIAFLNDNTKVGDKVTLSVLRNGKSISVDVTLVARPAASQQQQTSPSGNAAGGYLGVSVVPLDITINNAMNLPSGQRGLLVEQVVPGGPADQAGIQGSSQSFTDNGNKIMIGGDVLVRIDGTNLTSTNVLKAYLAQAQPGQQVMLTVLRNGQLGRVLVQLGQP
jgi:S1-C subfamily serine protease